MEALRSIFNFATQRDELKYDALPSSEAGLCVGVRS